MFTLTLPPIPIPYARRMDGYTLPARSAARDEGRLLTDRAEHAFGTWVSHSDFLARQVEETDPFDAPLGYGRFPLEKTVQATFTYVGELQPLPIPDLDD